MTSFAVFIVLTANMSEYDQHVSQLASQDFFTARKSLRKLESAGKFAFPAMLNRINDTRITNQDVVYVESVFLGNRRVKTTIGTACFMIMRMQLENGRLGAAAVHYIKPKNIQNWFDDNKQKSFRDMKIDVLKKTLELVCNDVSKRGIQENHLRQIQLISNHIAELKNEGMSEAIRGTILDPTRKSP